MLTAYFCYLLKQLAYCRLIVVSVCCPLQKKVESKVWRWYYWTFLLTREALVHSVDSVNASEDSTDKNSGWNRKVFISRGRKRWSTQSSLKEIVNFVFNKSTPVIWRTRLSRLILHKKETPRRRISSKNWIQNELWHKLPKNGILSLTKVKLTVGGWRHCFVQVCRYVSSSFFFFFLVIILSLLEYTLFCYLKFNVFDKHREKYAKPDFVKFISLEINYRAGTGCFYF